MTKVLAFSPVAMRSRARAPWWKRPAPARSRRRLSTPGCVDGDGRRHRPAGAPRGSYPQLSRRTIAPTGGRAVMPEKVEQVQGEGNFVHIEEGLTDAMAHNEVRRCLAATSALAAASAWPRAARWASRRCAWATQLRVGWPISTLPGRQSCASAAAPARSLSDGRNPPRRSGGVWRTIITGTVVREQPLLTCSECGAPTHTLAHRESTGSACRITWRPFWTADFARLALACEPIVPEDDSVFGLWTTAISLDC